MPNMEAIPWKTPNFVRFRGYDSAVHISDLAKAELEAQIEAFVQDVRAKHREGNTINA